MCIRDSPGSEDSGPARQSALAGQACAQTMARQCFDWLTHAEDSGPVMLWLCWNEQKTPTPLAQPLALALEGLQNLWRIGPVRLQCDPFAPGLVQEAEKLLRHMPEQGSDAVEAPGESASEAPPQRPLGVDQPLWPQTCLLYTSRCV